MKPSLLVLFSILGVHICYAQNYACIQRNEQRYFINEDGYLRGIRVNSFEVLGSDTVLHPFKTYRYIPTGSGMDTSRGSWLGANVRQGADGVFTFPTIWMRNVVVRTQALPGDTWVFYSDTSVRSYKATVMPIDTMTVLGMLDSIKTIRIAAYMGAAINPADSIDGYEIVISKEHGFVKTFDLYLFPYHTAGGTLVNDFYQDRLGSTRKQKTAFTLTEFHVPAQMEMYDFNEGDVFVTRDNQTNESLREDWLTYDSIVSKTFPDVWHVQYQIFRKQNHTTDNSSSSGYYDVHHYYYTETGTEQYDTSKLFSMPYMPEEAPTMPRVWHYQPEDTSNCLKSAYYKREDVVVFEGAPNYFEYKTGFEQISFATPTRWDNIVGPIGSWGHLVFSVKNGVPCGRRTEPVDVRNVTMRGGPVSIYPNPAANELYINNTTALNDISITDITGRRVYGAGTLPAKAAINVGNLAPGLYILRANGIVQKFVKQ